MVMKNLVVVKGVAGCWWKRWECRFCVLWLMRLVEVVTVVAMLVLEGSGCGGDTG